MIYKKTIKLQKRRTKVNICTRCIYDGEHIPNITFDSNGICNYCKEHNNIDKQHPISQEKFNALLKRMKGSGKYYDCIMGVSGGCDSSYLLSKLVDAGLKPLAVNFDNHWGTETAVKNLYKMTNGLGVDFLRVSVDKKEYDNIVRSFFLAGVPDIEIPADIGLATALLQSAAQYKCKYVVDGHSFRTEGSAPIGFIYMDAKYIESIQKQFGTIPIKTYPNLWMKKWLKWMLINRIKRVRPMYYLDYNKEEVKKELSNRFGWEWYGGHHFENRLTFFFHNYFNPKRFNRDQRYLDYSAAIRSGKMTRKEALKLIKKPLPQNNEIVEEVKQRMGFSDEEFNEIMKLPKKSHHDFKTYHPLFKRYRWFFWLCMKLDLVPKTFYMKYTSNKDEI